jgi:DEAD/DEAH box helicase domain-containing protein
MEIGGQRYRIEPQCKLGASEGVAVASKPDFVFWPWQAGASRRPIAVFCDGWTYHQNSLREDAAKRSALVASGNFWVWSVTHDDVKTALSGAAGTDLDSPLVVFNRHDGSTAPASLPRALNAAFSNHAVFQLLSVLAIPLGALGAQDSAIAQLQRNALWLSFLMMPANAADAALVKIAMDEWLPQLPVWLQKPSAKFAASVSRKDASPVALAWWPLSYIDGHLDGVSAPGVLVLNDLVDQNEQQPHLHWRRWLQLFNTMQTLPGMVMATIRGIQSGDLEALAPRALSPFAPAGSSDQVALSQEWAAAIAMTIEPLRAGLKVLATAGASPPVVGHELADARGIVVAEAEMAWPTEHLVLLTFDQGDLASVWANSGWTARVLDESCTNVHGVPWHQEVLAALGLAPPRELTPGDPT